MGRHRLGESLSPRSLDRDPTRIVLQDVQTILAEFSLPLEAGVATAPTQQKMRDFLAKCSNAGLIDRNNVVHGLNERRKQEADLQAAMVVLFDGEQYAIDPRSVGAKPDEPPEWGVADEDGVILLRLVSDPDQSLTILIRHEMGHLLGINSHHPGCVMDYNSWASREHRFCEKCVETIRQTCEVIALPG